jgi:hypothetical protein
MNQQCRYVIGIPVFLCLLHMLQAWLLKVLIKLRNKSRCEAQAPGTHDDKMKRLEAKIAAF